MEANFYHRKDCRMCEDSNLEKVLELTPTPPGNEFNAAPNISNQKFPLDLYLCKKCNHLQLGHVVDPKILYQNNYSYVSATSKEFVSHLETFAKKIIHDFKIPSESLVIDIGSNDGTCLRFFEQHKMRVLGIDPAFEVSQIANKNGIETINDFFTSKLAKKIKSSYGQAKLITSHNACAHIDNLSDVLLGVSELLRSDGILSIEVGYFVDVFSNTWFDTIYHEHLDYHTVEPFKYFFDKFSMEVVDVQRISPQGGSIRVIAQKKDGVYKPTTNFDKLVKIERDLKLNLPETYRNFSKEINYVGQSLFNLLTKLKSENKSIVGFGAPTKATTLMSHFRIGKDFIDYIVDDNPLKQNLYSPYEGIKVLNSDEIYKRKPDYLLILAWNFSDAIINNHKKFRENGGKFIIPMPTVNII